MSTASFREPQERPHSDGSRRRNKKYFVPPRGFDALLSPEETDFEDGFFIPTYLNQSVYMQQLENEHLTRIHAGQTKLQPGNGLNNHTLTDSAPALLPPGSHRGMSHTVVERSPSIEDAEVLSPLPSRWNEDDMWPGIEIEPNNVVKLIPQKPYHDRDQDAAGVRANHYMPPPCGLYYYEVTILGGKKDDTTIAVGFSTKTAMLSRPIGWEQESWGYHGDDGRAFAGQQSGKSYGPTFNKGDVIGCGINYRENNAFFTRNGIPLGVAFHDVCRGRLYPAISLKRPDEKIKANFGQEPFVFNIDQMMRDQRDKVLGDIAATDTSKLEPGMNESDLIQALVLQFLQHDGYVDTARAFAEEMRAGKEALNLDPNVKIDGINLQDDEDANNRQRIRSAILEGDVDKALKYTQAFYPKVLPANERVYFKLRCRKFIEMVRKAAQHSSATDGPNKSNGLAFGDASSQQMDLDYNSVETTGPGNAEVLELEQATLMYGRALEADYANHPEAFFSTGLQEIWGLMAYKNPLKEPEVKHLLDQRGRAAVAEELNSAILSSLGKSSRASLEKLYAQTTILLDELRRDGGEDYTLNVFDRSVFGGLTFFTNRDRAGTISTI